MPRSAGAMSDTNDPSRGVAARTLACRASRVLGRGTAIGLRRRSGRCDPSGIPVRGTWAFVWMSGLLHDLVGGMSRSSRGVGRPSRKCIVRWRCSGSSCAGRILNPGPDAAIVAGKLIQGTVASWDEHGRNCDAATPSYAARQLQPDARDSGFALAGPCPERRSGGCRAASRESWHPSAQSPGRSR